MNYKPRKPFIDFHTSNWRRAVVLSGRRNGKSLASAAETLTRAYNGPSDGQYFWCSPLAEQSVANVLGMFQKLDNGEGYLLKFDKYSNELLLANGAVITLGGARAIEKMRGRYLDGSIFDEFSDIPAEAFSDVISYCLADRDGWAAFLGTAKPAEDYRLYRMYQAYKDDPKWFTKLISIRDNPEAFSEERVQELYDEHIKYCLANGLSLAQAKASCNVELFCDFSFLDEGRPNMTAMFYNELSNVYNNHRILEATEMPLAPTIAVFDISHSVGRDYTVATYIRETPDKLFVTNIEWENDKPIAFWFDRLRTLGISTVALPFDASTTNKETLLTLNQTFKREGFNVIRIKRLGRPEQVENGRWLLNNAWFSKDTIPGLSQIGMFSEWKTKHTLSQDVVASFLYAAQVARKSHTKLEVANSVKTKYNNFINYDTSVSFYDALVTE